MRLGTFRDPEVLYEEEPEGRGAPCAGSTPPLTGRVQAQPPSPASRKYQSAPSGPKSKTRRTNSSLTTPTTTRRCPTPPRMLARRLTPRQVRIRFGVPPKKGSANVACPVTMTNSRGTLAIQSHRTAESKPLHGADANAWLDTSEPRPADRDSGSPRRGRNADAFDIVVYSNGAPIRRAAEFRHTDGGAGFKTLRCRAQLRALRSEQPELFNSRKARAAGKRTKHR